MPDTLSTTSPRWWSLPERAQATALSLLAVMIAGGVIDHDHDVDDEEVGVDDGHDG